MLRFRALSSLLVVASLFSHAISQTEQLSEDAEIWTLVCIGQHHYSKILILIFELVSFLIFGKSEV